MNYKSRRRIVGSAVVVFWLIMIGLLLRRELGVERIRGDFSGGDALSQATESRLGISLIDGPQVGTILLRQAPADRHDEPGALMTLRAQMRLQLLGKPTDLEISGSIWRSSSRPESAGTAIEFDFEIRSAGFDFGVAGSVGGGELSAQVTSAGETIPLSFPVDDAVIFSSGMGSAMRFPALAVGQEVLIDSFDPLTLSKSRARVRCRAEETLAVGGRDIATRRLEVETSGLRSVAWVDTAGEVVRAETPIGLVIERLELSDERPIPGDAGQATAASELLGHTAIRPSGLRPFRGAREMTFRVGGLEVPDLPQDRAQSALGSGRYRLQSPEINTVAAAAMANSAGAVALEPYLAADAFIQSDHPEIQGRADTITAGEEDPWARAVAIHDWVFERLDKEAVLSIPSALEVLQQRRGDCNEHTVLFTALARASGLPTRIAIGLVWSDELAGFYYHAWPEVFVEDWVWMDPTLGQNVADATHIKLLNGGIESWPRLLPYLGQITIEVLEIE